jgi:hypothetical protein
MSEGIYWVIVNNSHDPLFFMYFWLPIILLWLQAIINVILWVRQ